MTILRFHAELTSQRFAEIGRPSGGFRREDGKVIALCSEFGLLYWPGRAIYYGHRLRYRISLYGGNLDTRIGVFDTARYPINDVAFHPRKPLIAVGTGSYDGGYFFEGDLWLWNWETGETISLLGESREVVRCRFVDEDQLAVLLRPRYEDEFGKQEEEAFQTYVGVAINDFRDASEAGYRSLGGASDPRLDNLEPLNPKALGFTDLPNRFDKRHQSFFNVLGDMNGYEERARVWDILWLSDSRIALVHDNCQIEIWTTNGKREYVRTGEGAGIQILDTPDGPLVHVLRRGNFFNKTSDQSILYRLDPSGLQQLLRFDKAVVISVDQDGNLLCRDSGDLWGKRSRKDQLIASGLNEIFAGDIGHYDCFNHYIRLDGGDGLYFLRGTPKSSHENKKLCCIYADGSVTAVMDWDSQSSHLMNSIGCWGPKNTLIRAFYIYDPRPGNGVRQIQRCEIVSGRALWTRSITALVTSMVMIDDFALAFALTDGTLGLLDITDGKILYEESVAVAGIPTVAMSLAVRYPWLAIGTLDGRLLLYRIDDV